MVKTLLVDLGSQKICEQLFDLGVDVITSGNHIWDQKEIIFFLLKMKKD